MNFRLILALVVFAGPALGQSPPLKARILTVSLDQPLENAFFLNAGKVEPFTSDRSGLGTPFEYTGARELILRANADDFAAKPPVPPPLASVLLPTQARLVLSSAGVIPRASSSSRLTMSLREHFALVTTGFSIFRRRLCH